MTDEQSPTESQPTESEPTQAAPAEVPTEVIPQRKPWWRRPGVVGLVAGGIALITAIALVVVLVVLPDGSQQAEEQVFLTPLDDPGADPFTDASMATPLDPAMTTPGPIRRECRRQSRTRRAPCTAIPTASSAAPATRQRATDRV